MQDGINISYESGFFTREEFARYLSEAGFINIYIDIMKYTDNGIPVEMLIAKAEK